MALGSRIGSLYVRVGADTRQFHQAMDRANRPLEKFRVGAASAIKAFAAVGAAASAAAVGVYALARSEMNLIDEQAKLARSVGGTVTGLRTLKLAAEDNGIDGLESSLNRLNRRLGAVEMGGGPAAETVKRLGLNIKELSEMDIDDRLATIADTIRDSGISAQEAARHLQQLGFQQREATTFFMQGGDAIRAARGEIEDYGLAVSMLDAARMEEANTAMSRMSLVVQGLRTQLAIALAPTLLEIAQRFSNVARAIMRSIQPANDMDGAATRLGANRSIVDFAYHSGLAISRLVDLIRLLGDAVNTFAGYTEWWGATVRRNMFGPLEELVRLGSKINESMFADWVALFDGLEKIQQDGLEKSKQGWEDFWSYIETGQGRAERLFRESWAMPLPTITVPGDRGGGGGYTEDPSGRDNRSQEELERQQEIYQQRLQMLREFVAEEMEIEVFQHEQRLEQLRELWGEGIIPTDEEFMELREALELEHWDRITAIRERAEQDHLRNVQRAAQMENQLRQGVAQHAIGLLDQLAGKSKAAAIASIALNKMVALQRVAQTTAEASMLAYASQLVPGRPETIAAAAAAAAKTKALGAIQMGLIAATGLAQVASVTSSSSSLRGGASGSIGGRSTAPSSAVPDASPAAARSHTVINISLPGETYSRQQVRDLLEHINDAIADGATLNLR